jgi:hypothetical protein
VKSSEAEIVWTKFSPGFKERVKAKGIEGQRQTLDTLVETLKGFRQMTSLDLSSRHARLEYESHRFNEETDEKKFADYYGPHRSKH